MNLVYMLTQLSMQVQMFTNSRGTGNNTGAHVFVQNKPMHLEITGTLSSFYIALGSTTIFCFGSSNYIVCPLAQDMDQGINHAVHTSTSKINQQNMAISSGKLFHCTKENVCNIKRNFRQQTLQGSVRKHSESQLI